MALKTDTEFKPVLCIYHKDCLDGIGAAWVVWRHFKNMGIDIELVAAAYKDKLPVVDGKVVYVVDFSYPRDVMVELLGRAHDVVVLDHHTSAKRNLEGLFVVDESHSGAMLAWKYFNSTPPPEGLLYVEDRDLWKFKYPNTNNWVTAAFSYPFNVEQFDALMNSDPLDLIHEGKILLRKHQQDTGRVALNARMMKCMGYTVPVVNANIFFASDLGDMLSKDYPFALIYMDLPHGRKYSIRCQKKCMDVSKIAEYFGGGGHADASGFSIRYDDKRFARSHEVLDYSLRDKIMAYLKNPIVTLKFLLGKK
jgi:nanoRNase/pAp phosphatase (c-di-AMP/oligoRNAs hydrolase)